ncbi:hypothetical protein SAMD00019534_083640 [Acytostelium subglobosum LB1]|uniref:hypothetical protein n=1 Tax=Acytostelium subglobosum LB1 TaxID=1410327 RepID=UPI0006449CED|nr:hypothetical protein SAMD00019534_083640 [Acytostelium subglobosum LB1]GAM25189.1 hypothetical protein SAMD00019534_083640 [Acytostelium subglobosum LB1]|eukprot:XP_012751709.1 hypothetical protein SAMD00019534_083640 [Acytostelium subglobosum LB1]
MNTLYISIILLVTLVTFGHTQSLPQSEYNGLVEIVNLFKLQSIYPEPSDHGAIVFCGVNPIINCDSGFINSITLDGKGVTQVNDTLFNSFSKLKTIQLTNTLLSTNFLSTVANSTRPLVSLTCNNCSITTLDSTTIYANKLILQDNPITGTIIYDSISLVTYLDFTAIDPKNLKDVYLETSMTTFPNTFNGHLSSLDFTSCNSLSLLNIQLGPSFATADLSVLAKCKQLAHCNITDNHKQGIRALMTFPFETMQSGSMRLNLEQLDLVVPTAPINMSKYSQVTIKNMPGFNLNGAQCHSHTSHLLLESLNINNISMTSFNFSLLNGLSKTIVINLANNQLTGPLPTNLVQSNVRLDNNKFTGSVPLEYCSKSVSFKNNQLQGDLPSCFTCHLKDPLTLSYLTGNQFQNFQDNMPPSNYPKCTTMNITSVSTLTSTMPLVFNGTDLGFNNSNIYCPKYNLDFFIQVKSSQFLLPITQMNETMLNLFTKDGYIDIAFHDSDTKFRIRFDVGISINNVTYFNLPQLSYEFQILGAGFGQNISNVLVLIGSYNCIVYSAMEYSLSCNLYQLDLPITNYTVTVYVNSTRGQFQATYSYEYTRPTPYVTAIIPCSVKGGVVTLFGGFGTADTKDTIVVIGDLTCQVTMVNSSLLLCTLPEGTPGVKNITVTIKNVVWSGLRSFNYLENTLPCPLDCSGRGSCIQGHCYCNDYWGGPSCLDFHNGTIQVVPSPSGTTLTNTNNITFDFSIYKVVERDSDGKPVNTWLISNWTLVNSTADMWVYSASYDTATFTYSVRQFSQLTNVSFAGINMVMDPNSIKLSAKMENWRYLGRMNTLQVVIRSSVHLDEKKQQECETTRISSDAVDTGSLNYLTMERYGAMLYGRFIDRVLSDGRPTFSQVSILNQTDDGIEVGISLPVCTVCELDPDFSVLVSSRPPTACPGSSSERAWLIPTIVVVSVVGSIAVIVTVVLVTKRMFIFYYSKDHGVVIRLKAHRRSKS